MRRLHRSRWEVMLRCIPMRSKIYDHGGDAVAVRFCCRRRANAAQSAGNAKPAARARKKSGASEEAHHRAAVRDGCGQERGGAAGERSARPAAGAGTAISVVSPVDPAYAKRLATEGVQVEAQLIGAGEKPAASIMETGQVSCATATQFVDGLPAARVADAEQSIIGAVGVCTQAAQAARGETRFGTAQGQFAPRAFMATAERTGVKTPWSQSRFEKMMGELPDAKAGKKEAPNFAAMYARMAPEVDKSVASKAGLDLLLWLSKVEDSPERNLAVTIMTRCHEAGAGQRGVRGGAALGRDRAANSGHHRADGRDACGRGRKCLRARRRCSNANEDQTDSLSGLPPGLRARQAAAAGFANGTAGEPGEGAEVFRYRVSGVDEAWQQRQPGKNSPQRVEEVCEAAAQVNTVDALKRCGTSGRARGAGDRHAGGSSDGAGERTMRAERVGKGRRRGEDISIVTLRCPKCPREFRTLAWIAQARRRCVRGARWR